MKASTPTGSGLSNRRQNAALSLGPHHFDLSKAGTKQVRAMAANIGGGGPHVFVREPLRPERKVGT